ncbi:EamA family transporter RarD [Acinetobacter qingfengensis]|uniref:Permease n=1 Tax=Acinetobacter qingfengensis TaxID=1262585 RepID=A0A1E7QYV3_9GAMM|nr:EamA family transporter RarD [Acinetobacter qingfengensis]KAA8730977.1 EamA family transporter RarD [Acinetobacter qingfengensis]OEY92244.1 permease [Acinetobacter qingfengensis]
MFRGIGLSVLASVTFGFLYLYSKLLAPLDSGQTFGWRLIATIPFLTLIMWCFGDIKLIGEIFKRIIEKPIFLLFLLLSSFLASVQLWLFLWAPMNDRGLEVSLGYFLLPLVLVFSGSLLYKEKLSFLQKIAVFFALIGVGHEFWQHGMIAWETAVVAFGYTAYFLLRKKIQTDHLGGFWWDIALSLPVAFFFVLSRDGLAVFSQYPILWLIIIGLGVLSTLGLGSYILSSRYLPLVLFGLLSYLEPVLLAIASLFLGESIQTDELLTYIPIWLAVFVLVIEGALHLIKQHRQKLALRKKTKYLNKM